MIIIKLAVMLFNQLVRSEIIETRVLRCLKHCEKRGHSLASGSGWQTMHNAHVERAPAVHVMFK